MARKTIPLTCQHCGTIFHRRPRSSPNRNQYCSNACGNLARYAKQHPPLLARFLRFVSYDVSGCWMWTGPVNGSGYARFWNKRRAVAASRIAYALFVRPLTPDELACHRCDQPLCVNPDHIFPGTYADNMRDMCLKDRRSQKISPAQVRAIRDDTRILRVIAAEYGLSETHVWNIQKRKVWRHLD